MNDFPKIVDRNKTLSFKAEVFRKIALIFIKEWY